MIESVERIEAISTPQKQTGKSINVHVNFAIISYELVHRFRRCFSKTLHIQAHDMQHVLLLHSGVPGSINRSAIKSLLTKRLSSAPSLASKSPRLCKKPTLFPKLSRYWYKTKNEKCSVVNYRSRPMLVKYSTIDVSRALPSRLT